MAGLGSLLSLTGRWFSPSRSLQIPTPQQDDDLFADDDRFFRLSQPTPPPPPARPDPFADDDQFFGVKPLPPPQMDIVPPVRGPVNLRGNEMEANVKEFGLTPDERRIMVGSEARLQDYLRGPVNLPTPPPKAPEPLPPLLAKASNFAEAVAPFTPGSLSAVAARGTVHGIGSAMETAGGAAMAADPYGKATAGSGAKLREGGKWLQGQFAPPEDIASSISNDPSVLANPRWWAFNGPTMAGAAAAIYASGGVGSAGVGLLGRAIQARPWLQAAFEVAGAGTASGVAEAALEGGGVYSKLIDEGVSHQVAAERAAQVAKQNLILLSGTNAAQFAVNKIPMARAISALVSGGFEGFQENRQNVISAKAEGRPEDEGELESTALGFGTGVLFGMAGGHGPRRPDAATPPTPAPPPPPPVAGAAPAPPAAAPFSSKAPTPPAAMAPGVTVRTPTGEVATVTKVVQLRGGDARDTRVVVRLPDGTAKGYRPDALTTTATERDLVAMNEPRQGDDAAFPPVREGETVMDYQRRTGTLHDVAKARVDAATSWRASEARLPFKERAALAANRPPVAVAEPPAPAAPPTITSDETTGRHAIALPEGRGEINLIDPAQAAKNAQARGADQQIVDDWNALPANHLYVDAAQVQTPRQGDGTKLYEAAVAFAANHGYAGLASNPASRTPAANALWASLARQGNVQRVGDYDVLALPPASAQGIPDARTEEAGTTADLGEAERLPGTAAPNVYAPAGEDRAAAETPADRAAARSDFIQSVATHVNAHPELADRGWTARPTPEGHVELRHPGGGRLVAEVRPASGMPFTASDNQLASLHAELEGAGRTATYKVDGAEHTVPRTAQDFAALPQAHRDAALSEYQVAGLHDPSTGRIHINEEFALRGPVWHEEVFHAGVARLTPEERVARGIGTTKAEEEAAHRRGVSIEPEVYARQRGNLGSEGQPHGTQEEADALAGAARQVRRPDGTGDEGVGARSYAARARGGEGGVRDADEGAAAEVESSFLSRVAADFDQLVTTIHKPDGGFTYSPFSGSPTTGFAVSVTKGAELIIDPKDFTAKRLLAYMREHAALLRDDARSHVGAWHSPQDGKVYLDISTVVKTRDEAERLGNENQQHAYFDLSEGKSTLTRWGEARRVEQLVNQAAPTVLRGTTPGGPLSGPKLTHKPEPSYAVVKKSKDEPRPVAAYAPVENTAALESMMPKAQEGTFKTRRDLKVYMEDLVRRASKEAGVSIDPATPEGRDYMVRVGVRDALFAIQTNPNAVGWYDTTVGKALAVLGTIHPELETDANKRFAFTFALAATSNGLKVNKNFQLAEQAYEHFKRTGAMPTDVGQGTASKQINAALSEFNHLSGKWGIDTFRKFMLSQFTASEITRLGFDVGDEPAGLVARGALIVGAKIGNGFFSNLNGHFDSLTMDRWLMRTWGRWSGQLFYDNAKLIKANQERTGKSVEAIVRRSPRASATFSELLGIDLSKVKGPKAIDRVAVAIRKSSEKPVNRAAMNQTALGQELRKAGNIHAQNLDAQKEAPDTGTERTRIRDVFDRILKDVRAQGHPALTTADLQALLWYPEKRLYDKATTQDEVASGYEDEEAPDYANAAVALARSVDVHDRAIADALDRGARDGARRAGSGGSAADGFAAQTFSPDERRAFLDRYAKPATKRSPTLESVTKTQEPSYEPSYAVRRIGFVAPDGADHTANKTGGGLGGYGEDHTDLARRLLNDKTGGGVRKALGSGYLRYWVRNGELALNFKGGEPRTATNALRFVRDNFTDGDRIYLDIEGPHGVDLGKFYDNVREANQTIRRAGKLSPATKPEEPSYSVRRKGDDDDPLTLAKLQRRATDDGVSLADAVTQARTEGRDIDVSDYFNLGRVDLPPAERQALNDQIVDTVVETGRVPKERESWDTIRAEAKQLGGVDLQKELEPFFLQQAPFRAVRDAARHRINELSREVFEQRTAMAGMPSELAVEEERAINEKEQTIHKLLDTWMRIRSEDGRNLAMHGMMSDSMGWNWTDSAYWLSKAKRELGLPNGVEIPPDIYARLQDILKRGEQASREAKKEAGETEDAPESRGPMTRRPAVEGPVLPPKESRGPMTSRPPVEGPVLPPVESRGPMERQPPTEGPVLPPVEPREGSMTSRPRVEGPVLPPEESRGPMSRGPAVEGPVLPPAESRGPMTRGPAVEGPVLPPAEPRGPMTRGPAVEGPVLPPEKSRGRMTSSDRPRVEGPVLPPEKSRGRMTRRTPTTPKERAVQQELVDLFKNLKKTDWWTALALLRKANLLTGVKTHLRNLSGNTTFQVMEELSRVPASIVDAVISLRTGVRTVQGASPTAVAKASYEAATRGVREAGDVLKHGTHTPGELRNLGASREMNTGIKWLDAYTNYVFRSLSAEDRVFNAFAFRRSLEAQAALQSRNLKGAKTAEEILAAPTEAMLTRATSDAAFATFNNQNFLGSAWQAGHGTLRRGGIAGKATALATDILVPFTNTPSNILARLFDYTPIGAVPRAVVAAGRGMGGGKPPTTPPTGKAAAEPSDDAKRAANTLVKKGLTQSQQEVFSMAVGRGLVGSALMLLGYWLAEKGLATGVRDEDEGKRNVKEAAGQSPGAVLVNGKWRRVDSIAPIGNLITLGATLSERGPSLTTMATAGLKTATELPMLEGVQQGMQAANEPDRFFRRFASGQVGSFVPTAVADVASAADKYRRDPRPSESMGDTLTHGARERTPWFRQKLPLRTNVFGEPLEQQRISSLDPTLPSPDLSDAIIRELQAHDVGISSTSKVKGLETDDEHRDRAIAVGQAIKSRLQTVLDSDSYQNLDFDKQTELLERVIEQARNTVPRPKAARAGGR